MMGRGTAENTLLFAPVLNHQEFGSHYEKICAAIFNGDIADDSTCARPRLLRVHPWAGQTANAGFKQTAIVIDQRHSLEWIALSWLARHPIPGVRREQSQPIIEFALVKKPRLIQQKLLAVTKIEQWPCGHAARTRCRPAAVRRRRFACAF